MAPRQATVEVGEAKPGETKVRRSFCSPDKLVERPVEGVNTMAEVLEYAVNKFGSKPMVGYRDLIKMHKEEKEITKKVDGKYQKEKKTWEYFELSDYKYITYKEFADRVKVISSGLIHLGLSNSTRFNIYASTAVNWQLMAHACFAQGITFCTAYDTLGEEGLQHSLDEPEVVGLFTNAELLGTLGNVVADTPHLKYVIYDGEDKKGALEKITKTLEERGGRTLHLDELFKEGKEHPAEPNLPKADDIAAIMYTSGSTGKPKGVILKQSNIVAAIGAVLLLLGDYLHPMDTFLAYLPLAHILEFVVECALMTAGVTMGYGRVKTLTSNSTRNCQGDLQTFRPSVLVGVPAVFELIRKGIAAKVNAGGSIKKNVFNAAMTIKKNNVPILTRVVDNVVFKQVRDQTGGRLRLALSGGAPLSRETQEFLNVALVQLLQGYGMTESSAMCAILTPEFYQYTCVGVISPAIECKLIDVPEAGYFASNDPPQGEILIRGPAVTSGYFKREDVTKETISDDGWLMTGDVGQWNKDGTLSIIDRKKNLVKLSGGEYIAIERLESTYKASEVVSNICVVANSNAKQPMAVIFPHEQNLKGALGSDAELAELIKDKNARSVVLNAVNQVGKKAGFKAMEQLQTVILVCEELPMTAAQKLERKKVEEKYKDQINTVYP
ncbi:acetyl-CoA synthetase-like protein [Tilletiaria anomala UBC 951]|uniref:Acetyl-CoA synthetase-like protein n=1 Tax=Tilletiaria anomala (strain ATCC 24038 / CBS 436.72 / UBC 951) TaxID=1037660 RepID=A0A066VG77_TILAU|nr:acetyl-CoA synthetase-like protein [Tilletiaria anomala UBC 951]KDN37585.1 acetyl-CoA synthetase-like protein [Tilletiaria anomala UBC 951]